MFNITIINLRKLLKKIIILVFIILCILVIILLFSKNLKPIYGLINKKSKDFLSTEITLINYEKEKISKGYTKILNSELVDVANINVDNLDEKLLDVEIKAENNMENGQESENNLITNNINIDINYKDLATEVIKENNISEKYNVKYDNVKIKNESSYVLTDEMLNPNIEYKNKKDILIFHTHTCESYTKTKENSYVESGLFRTINLKYSVAKVGDVLEEILVSKDFNVIHDKTFHDYPAYTGSYNRSMNTVKSILEKNPQIQMVIDLHRDAIGNNSDYAPKVKIGNEIVAQLMFVIGTNGGGLKHDNWQNNLKYAIKIQEKANEMFPGLFRPVILRNSRYNQNLADSAFIIEVGATGNTLEECSNSMKYLGKVIEEVMK